MKCHLQSLSVALLRVEALRQGLTKSPLIFCVFVGNVKSLKKSLGCFWANSVLSTFANLQLRTLLLTQVSFQIGRPTPKYCFYIFFSYYLPLKEHHSRNVLNLQRKQVNNRMQVLIKKIHQTDRRPITRYFRYEVLFILLPTFGDLGIVLNLRGTRYLINIYYWGVIG